MAVRVKHLVVILSSIVLLHLVSRTDGYVWQSKDQLMAYVNKYFNSKSLRFSSCAFEFIHSFLVQTDSVEFSKLDSARKTNSLVFYQLQ